MEQPQDRETADTKGAANKTYMYMKCIDVYGKKKYHGIFFVTEFPNRIITISSGLFSIACNIMEASQDRQTADTKDTNKT